MKIDANDIQAIRELYAFYQYQELTTKEVEEKRCAENPTYELVDFHIQNLNALDLFNTFDEIVQTWGAGDISFFELETVFSVYMKHSPNNSAKVLRLFSTLFQLVAKILQHKDIVHKEYVKYERLTEMVDLNEELILSN